MKYRNTRTQAVIETTCVVSGGYWVAVKEHTKQKKAAKRIVKKKSGE